MPSLRILLTGSVGTLDDAKDVRGAIEALSQAGFARDEIDVLHGEEDSPRNGPSDTMLDRAADRPSGGDPAAARGLLRDFVAAMASGSVATAERIEHGEPHDRIVSLARDEGFDLIVMGTLGRTGRPLALVGSVAESVVRISPVPVLTVREVTKAGP